MQNLVRTLLMYWLNCRKMIRKLMNKDKELMYEWMHDKDVTKFLNTDFSSKTIEDCEEFINNSITDLNKNFAIVNDKDEYLGTVSLKNIDYYHKIAEMAITIRKCAMGKGYSKMAIDEIFEYGKKELGLTRFYWYVKPSNTRAVKFYDRYNFKRTNSIDIFSKLDDKYLWYLFC